MRFFCFALKSGGIEAFMNQGFKDAPTPRPNKRRRLDPAQEPSGEVAAPSVRPKSGTVSDSPKKKEKQDDQLDAFMQVMQPRTKKGPSWANDFDIGTGQSSTSAGKQTKTDKTENANVNNEKNDNISDLDWMKQRMSKAVDDETEKAYEQSDDEEKDPDQKPGQVDNSTTLRCPLLDHRFCPAQPTVEEPEVTDPNKDIILRTSRLFLRNLVYSCTESDLLELFQRFGEISQVSVRVSFTSLIFMSSRTSSTCWKDDKTHRDIRLHWRVLTLWEIDSIVFLTFCSSSLMICLEADYNPL